MITDRVGLYLHIPFCASKCYYCDFCSTCRADDDKKQKYVDALCREISFIAEKIKQSQGELPIADTVYFGGGTPTLLSISQFEQILNAVKRSFNICEDAEITCEANPKTADMEKLAAMKKLGINRLSIGMQSVHDNELKALGRIHNYRDFKVVFESARQAGFDNISVDLMYGIPEQTMDSFMSSVEETIKIKPDHISSYCLTVEDNTPFGRRRDSLVLPDEDTVSEMYSLMTDILEKHGCHKYEISNFANTDKESRHNIKYWQCEEYLGFGVAAHSYFDGVRYGHSNDIDGYINGEEIYTDVEKIDPEASMNEYVMLGMRMKHGVDISKFEQRFKVSFQDTFGYKIRLFMPKYVEIEEGRCFFTNEGMFVSNYILSEILDF